MSYSPLIGTLADLVRIKSVNPAYQHGCPEHDIQVLVRDFFSHRSIPVCEQEVAPDRSNVIGHLAGRNPARRVVFEAHCDTAGTEGMTIPPFEPSLRNGSLSGRGSCDTKAGLAAMMHALADVAASGTAPPCEIWVVSVVDEEYGYCGVLRLRESLRDCVAAVVSEPTEMRTAVASKGCLRWRINVRGRAAHSSKPHLGANAISAMAHLLLALEADRERLNVIRHPLLGSPTLNIGTIRGGTQVNTVPDLCCVELDRRLIPGEDHASVLAHYEAVVDEVRRENKLLDFQIDSPMLQDCVLETSLDAPIVRVAARVLRDLGLNPEPIGVPFGCDASKLAQVNIPSIVLGPGSIDQAHTAEEYVKIEQVEQAMLVYRGIMTEFE